MTRQPTESDDGLTVAEREAGELYRLIAETGTQGTVPREQVVRHFQRAEHTARRRGTRRGTVIGSAVGLVGVAVAVAAFVQARDDRNAESARADERAALRAEQEAHKLNDTRGQLLNLESEVQEFKGEASKAHNRIERSIDTLSHSVRANSEAVMRAVRSQRRKR